MPRWTKEQELAIFENGKNIIVSAGAGSGKTAVLSERVLEKVLNNVDVDRLLILTFTKAAAAEMKERIRKKIKEKDLVDQLNKIDSSYITTFDSYSLSLVKKYHYLLNIKKDVNIIEKNILDIKIKEYLDKIMEEEYLEKDSDFCKLINDFCIKDDDNIRKSILSLNNKLNMKYNKKEYLDTYCDNFYSEEMINENILLYENLLKEKVKEYNLLLDKICELTDVDYFHKILDISNALINSNTYDEIKKGVSLISMLPRLPRGCDEDVKQVKENLKETLDEIKELCLYDNKEELANTIYKTKSYVKAIIRIIQNLDEKLDTYKRENDLYDFVDISKMAIKIVKENENIKEEIRNYFLEIMVDEYQDTSDLQEEFINEISNNNLYMVGDVKQSIYRFRNANPNIFRNKYNNYSQGINGMKIDLLKNFRSREEVLKNINLIFDFIMSEDIGGANYKLEHRMNFGNDSYNTLGGTNENNNMELYYYDYDKTLGFTKDEIEAFIIADDIKKKIESHYQVFDKDKQVLRNITYDDFSILIDRSTSFDLYKKVFLYKQIPLSIYKDEYLTNSNIFLVIKNIFKLLSLFKNKGNKKEIEYSYLSVGRSFLCDYNDNYLFDNIRNHQYEEDEIIKKIRKILNNIESKSISNVLDEIIIEFDIYNKLSTISSLEENIVKIDYMYSLAKSLSDMGYNYTNFSSYLEDIFDNKIDISFPVNKEMGDSVKIMTIHKSKGLEYHLCYFTGLTKRFNTDDLKQRIILSNKLGIITPIMNDGIMNTFYKQIYTQEYLYDEIGEKIRLFYVALTRAKEKMIFVLPNNIKEEVYTDDMVDTSLRMKYRSFSDILDSIKSKLQDYIKIIDINSLNLTKDYNLNKGNNIFKNFKINGEKINIIDYPKYEKKEKQESHFSKSNISLISKEQKEVMDFGTKIHYYMETLDLANPSFIGIDNKYIEKIKDFLYSPLMKNINKGKVYQEYEFMMENEEEEKHGVIDLMIEYDDYIDIIDYKLKNILDDAYDKQLSGYRDYIEKITNKRVYAYLYSIMDNKYRKC